MSDVNSETISRLIIDKLISNTIIEDKLKHVDSIFNRHLEKFIFKLISPYMKSEFFFHEKGLDKIDDENIIYFKEKKISKINTWITIPEPKTCEIDRYASRNKLVKPKLQNNDKNKIFPDNSLKELESEHDMKNYKAINKNQMTNKRKKMYRNKILKLNILFKKQNIDSNNNKNLKEKKKEPVLEIPGIYIPYSNKEKINILLNDTKENNYLRNEWKLNMIEKEKKLLKEQLMKKKAKPKFLMNKETKLINSNELTFDSNGNILRLNLNKINSFKQDFISSKVSLKNKNEEINHVETNSQLIKKSFNANKRKLSKKKLEDIKESNNNDEIVEYNLEEKMIYDGDFNNYFNKNLNTKNNIEKKILSGSNFEKMRPEIGVIISNTDNEKEKKSGGFEYIKKYNRPSMNELSQFLSSSNNNLNSNYNNSNNKIASFLYSYSNNNNNDNEKMKNNYIGYKERFNDDKNPLFKNAVHINEGESRNLLLKREMANKKSLSNENIFRKKNSLKKGKGNDNIILFKGHNINNNDINRNYLSSLNNIFLSDKFNFSNLKSVFSDDNEKYINTEINRISNKNLGKIKVMKENKSNLIYSMKDIKRDNKDFLPNINSDKNKKILGRDYINKFLINTIQKRNLSYGNIDNVDDINKENSYKNQFLKFKRNSMKNTNEK